jgi:hypothetical protein
VRKLVDVVDNRVAANLAAIESTLLIELPADRFVLLCARLLQLLPAIADHC